VVSVDRPCLITFLTDFMDENLKVNGAAMQASPSSSESPAESAAISF
jgi:hypothetical protein